MKRVWQRMSKAYQMRQALAAAIDLLISEQAASAPGGKAAAESPEQAKRGRK